MMIPSMLTKQELADRFRISIPTVDRLTAAGKLPRPLKIGRAVRYLTKAVARFEEGGGPATRAMLDSLIGSAETTKEEVATVKAMAERSISRVQELGLGYVALRHVCRARAPQ